MNCRSSHVLALVAAAIFGLLLASPATAQPDAPASPDPASVAETAPANQQPAAPRPTPRDDGPGVGGALVLLFPLVFGCFFLILGFGLLALWIWALVDCLQRDFPGDNDKLIWVLVVVLLNWIGAILYLVIGRDRGQKPPRPTQ